MVILYRAARHRPLSETRKQHNNTLSKGCYVIERTFGTLKRLMGFSRARYFGLGKVTAQAYLKAMCVNLLKAANKIKGIRVLIYA